LAGYLSAASRSRLVLSASFQSLMRPKVDRSVRERQEGEKHGLLCNTSNVPQ
jgi:hypothetical protein